mmetsp:Transcript_69829/g.227177  ORF Transcript_69829/g.227177 Transcript_69829/m.227177 type:complete len:390 (-) Transcript_69829:15-1184(-)
MSHVSEVGFAHFEEIRTTCTFKNFSAIAAKIPGGQFVQSPILFCIQGHDFVLRLFPHGDVTGTEGPVAVFLRRSNGPQEPIMARFAFGCGTQAANIINHAYVDFLKDACQGYRKLVDASALPALLRSCDNLVISIHVMACVGQYSGVGSGHLAVVQDKSLADDFATLLGSGLAADVVLKLADGERHVHKAVLVARSVVFRQMFETDMTELRTGQVNISDFQGSVMDIFLQFLYTGRLPEGDANKLGMCRSVLPVAKKYEVAGLTEHCCGVLAQGLAVDNAVDFLQLADTFDIQSLKEAAMKFIACNRETLVAVQDTPAFDNLDKDLMKELFAAVTGVTGTKRPHAETHEFPDDSDWSSMTLAQLRRACSERKLPSAGNKAALRARLPST